MRRAVKSLTTDEKSKGSGEKVSVPGKSSTQGPPQRKGGGGCGRPC